MFYVKKHFIAYIFQIAYEQLKAPIQIPLNIFIFLSLKLFDKYEMI